MATIVKGTTFTGTVTAGGMHALIESATISGIDRGVLRTSEISVATLLTVPPTSPYANEVWQTSPADLLATYDSSNSRWRGSLPTIIRYTLDSTGSAVTAGKALVPFGTGGLDALVLMLRDSSYGLPVVAIALNAVNPGSAGLAVVAGPALAAVTGTISPGQSLKLSSTAGVLQSAAVGTGIGIEFVATAIGADSGGFAWVDLRR